MMPCDLSDVPVANLFTSLKLATLIPFDQSSYKIYLNGVEFLLPVRQCGPVVRALALRSGDPGFKTRSDHSLNLFLVVPGSTSQLHL